MIPEDQSSAAFLPCQPETAAARPRSFPLVSRSRWMDAELLSLLNSLAMTVPEDLAGLPVRALATDAREVEEGALFVCRGRGEGARLEVEEALKRGASLVLGQEGAIDGVPSFLPVEDPRRALAALSSAFHRHPSQTLRCCAVAGGLGKTTSAALVRDFLEVNARRCGLVSSLGHETGLASYLPYNTTPSVERVHALLGEMCEAERDAAVIELSRRALLQGRADAVDFEVALVCNTTGIHDEESFEALCDLLRSLPGGSVAVLNRDDEAFEVLSSVCEVPVMSFGVQRAAEVSGRILRADARGSVIEVRLPGSRFQVRSSLVGHHNVENAMAAVATAIAMGVDPERAAERLHRIAAVPGRLERIPGSKTQVFLDAASDAPSLARALGDLRPLVDGRLWVVLGASVRLSTDERARLAAVAETWADQVVLTSDDPGAGHPMTLIREMTEGMQRPRRARIAEEREDAIHLALEGAEADDAVVIVRRQQGSGLFWALGDGEDDRAVVERYGR